MILLSSIIIKPLLCFNGDNENQEDFLKKLIAFLFGNNTQQEKKGSVDYYAIEKSVEHTIDRLLATPEQSSVEQKKIASFKKNAVNGIISLLKQERSLSDDAASQKGATLARQSIKEFIRSESAHYTEQYLQKIRSNPPINPALLKKVDHAKITSIIYEQIASDTDAILHRYNEYGCLKNMIGRNLETRVQSIIDNKFGITQSSKEYEIYELYPNFETLDRNKNFHTRRESGKLHRSDECPVCLEKFKKIGKRANLFCGHCVCPDDLYNILYASNNQKSCPLCRQEIKTTEFTQAYLRSHLP